MHIHMSITTPLLVHHRILIYRCYSPRAQCSRPDRSLSNTIHAHPASQCTISTLVCPQLPVFVFVYLSIYRFVSIPVSLCRSIYSLTHTLTDSRIRSLTHSGLLPTFYLIILLFHSCRMSWVVCCC